MNLVLKVHVLAGLTLTLACQSGGGASDASDSDAFVPAPFDAATNDSGITADLGSDPDPRDMSPSDLGTMDCHTLFGGHDSAVHCDSRPGTCEVALDLDGESCRTGCAEAGLGCITSYDNLMPTCEREAEASCDEGRATQICVCGGVPDAPDAGMDGGIVVDGGMRDETHVIFYDGFEDSELGSAYATQGCEAWSIEVAEEGYRGSPAARAGSGMLRTETRPGDRKPIACEPGSRGHRAEVYLRDRFSVGDDIWIGFSVYLPESFDLVEKIYLMQIHGHEAAADGGCVGVNRKTPMTWLRIENRRAAFVYGQHERHGTVDDWPIDERALGRWHDVVVHYRPSPNANGRLEVWWDGVKRVDDRGVNMCPAARPYLKLGLYQHDDDIAYFDELRIGDPATASYVDVAP